MSKVSKNIGFTVPPEMADELERFAREDRSTKSEFFRHMFRVYKTYRNTVRQRTDNTAGWVERLILEAQEEERRDPMPAGEFMTRIEKAQRYGERRAKALGIESEEQLNETLYAERKAARRP